jgi:cytochrome c oxidase subunit 2
MIKWFLGLAMIVLMSACWHKPKKSTVSNEAQPISGNVEAGRVIYNNTCKTCHGENGEGNLKFQAPALANSDDWYLYRQLINYRNGIRGYDDHDTVAFQMAAMVKTLKDTVAVADVIAYIKIMPGVSVAQKNAGDKKNGKNIYQGICGSCHGANASGNRKLNAPRLSGLSDWYLKQQILKFKKSIRGAHPNDKLGAQMITMMAMLPDEQSINDVVAYMQSAGEPNSK